MARSDGGAQFARGGVTRQTAMIVFGVLAMLAVFFQVSSEVAARKIASNMEKRGESMEGFGKSMEELGKAMLVFLLTV